MNTQLSTLYPDLMALCQGDDSAFYYVDHVGPDGKNYRVFTYRLASFSDFQKRNAMECRGHTFRLNDDGTTELVSLPMQKFFNYGEHLGWGTQMDLNNITMVMDKLDGSLISTVKLPKFEPKSWDDLPGVSPDGLSHTGFFLKSKTSFSSKQALDATAWLLHPDNFSFMSAVYAMVLSGHTVNFEWTAPDNTIVVCYAEPRLTVLNVRHNETGNYYSIDALRKFFGAENVVKTLPIPANGDEFIKEIENATGIEGVIICFGDGLWVKHKTSAYCALHKTKDSINNPKALWEVCVYEGADDVRALFHADALAVARINEMEEKVAKIYNHIHQTVHNFFNENKDLDRKSYAILGQEKLNREGLFSLAMNLYLGKECDIKAFMVKHYKRYGIKDEYSGVE